MRTQVTMSVRGILLAGLVLLALVTAYLLGGGTGGPQAVAASAPAVAPQHRTVTMTGVGKATVVPDRLGFDLSVALTRTDLGTAMADASRLMDKVLGSLSAYGVKRGDVRTTGLSMSPVYDYHAYSPPTLRGYRVSQRAAVLVKELRQGGAAVSAAVAAGGNDVRVSDIRLQVGDPEAAMQKARDAAVAEATTKARQYAEAAGESLGQVVTLHEVRSAGAVQLQRGYAMRATAGVLDSAALPALPVRGGHSDLSVTVQVVWDFR
ncbi:MAG: SIMPL domain-containing protein [Nocardioides sp.]